MNGVLTEKNERPPGVVTEDTRKHHVIKALQFDARRESPEELFTWLELEKGRSSPAGTHGDGNFLSKRVQKVNYSAFVRGNYSRYRLVAIYGDELPKGSTLSQFHAEAKKRGLIAPPCRCAPILAVDVDVSDLVKLITEGVNLVVIAHDPIPEMGGVANLMNIWNDDGRWALSFDSLEERINNHDVVYFFFDPNGSTSE